MEEISPRQEMPLNPREADKGNNIENDGKGIGCMEAL